MNFFLIILAVSCITVFIMNYVKFILINSIYSELFKKLLRKIKFNFKRGIFLRKPALTGRHGNFRITIEPSEPGINIKTYKKKTKQFLIKYTNLKKNKNTYIKLHISGEIPAESNLIIKKRLKNKKNQILTYRTGNEDFDNNFTVSGNTDLIVEKMNNKIIKLILEADKTCNNLIIKNSSAECIYAIENSPIDKENICNLIRILSEIMENFS
jgi:hypothetical protein